MADLMESSWPPPKRPRRLKLWFTLGAGVLALMVLGGVVRNVVVSHFVHVELFRVSQSNMEPTIEPGTFIQVSPVSHGRYRPRRGDVVVFRIPGGWQDRTGDLAERVIGLPGQTVSCAGDFRPLEVDGTPLNETYASSLGCGSAPYHVTVPAGRIWMLGDNRDVAYDSHQIYLRDRNARTASVATSAVIGVRATS